ncbi:hypothetical protein OSB04_017287 [Centaurea solstitialis]|uniref:PPM-type phosphatase domain-containing protein n=1 Tax=Centaurea solstitialis TaxID=347529 RepID=A0AA38TKQ1_9ASTR|nr:hypothetical protein OSB04_017287 [Centaurea solstitialis]
MGFYFSAPFMLTLVGLIILSVIVLLAALYVPYFQELMSNDHRPPVVGSTMNMLINFNHYFDYVTLIAKKHHTFRFVTPTHSEVYITDPINVEHILRTNFPNYTKGDYHKGIMGDLFGNGIFAADGDLWRHQRKLASFEFSTKVLRDFSTDVFRSNTAKLVRKVSEASADKQIISLQDLLMKSTLDSIFKVGFGFDLNTLSGLDEVSNRFMKAFDDSNCIIFWRYVDLLWRVKRYLNIGSEAALKTNIRVIDNFVYELINHKREQMKNGKLDGDKDDILSRFLIESEKNPANLSDQYLRDISLSFIIAGKDTSANTLTWFFYMLCKHKTIQEKVALEVKEAIGAEHMYSVDEFSSKLTEAALDKMHYLYAALTETLRLYPAVPLDGKFSEKDDILPDGFKIKKGDGISYMAYPMGRMTYIWGEDAEEFRPERWLRDGVFQPESPFKFTAFQGGPRICLGKEFAYRQMKIMAAFLVFFFKFQLVDENEEATYRTMFTLHMDKGLYLYALPRLPPDLQFAQETREGKAKTICQAPFMLTLVGLMILSVISLLTAIHVPYFQELISNDHRPPLVGSTVNMLIHFNHLFDYMTLIARKHHTFRFINPTHSEVYTADPVNVEHILKTNFPNYIKGAYQKEIMGDLFGNGIFVADGDIWRHQRKLASFEFSTKILRDFSTAVFMANTTKLVKKVSEASVRKQVIALQDLLMKTTLDSMFKVGFGFDLDTLSGSDEVSNRFIKAFDDSNCIIFWRYVDPLWRLKRYLNIGSEAALKTSIRVIDNFVYELIDHKREQIKNRKLDGDRDDILSRFLIESEINPVSLTDQYLRDISLSFIVAGKDTSANTLTWFFYMLCKHNLIQEKVALEVKEATGAEYTDSINEFSRNLTETSLNKMHYLHAALTETLRLYPAVPLDGKCAAKDDVLPDGFKIKKGDEVSYMAYPMGRMTYIWGEDAEEFRPERWLIDGVFGQKALSSLLPFRPDASIISDRRKQIPVVISDHPLDDMGHSFCYIRPDPSLYGNRKSAMESTEEDEDSPVKCRERRRRRIAMRRMAAVASRSSVVVRGNEGGLKVMNSSSVEYGMLSVVGRQRQMEDQVSALCKENMHVIMEEELMRAMVIGGESNGGGGGGELWRNAINSSFQRMDEMALRLCLCGGGSNNCRCGPQLSFMGSTAAVSIVTKDNIFVANCGDSRAVLCRNGRPIPLSVDHKPDREDERARIEGRGGRITFANGARVEGILSMSRAIGDRVLKQWVTSEPEISITRREAGDECLIVGSDGLWDVLSTELVCKILHDCLVENEPRIEADEGVTRVDLAATLLVRLALGRRSTDNISVIVVDLRN